MTNDEIKQYIIDKLPYELENSGIMNIYYVISVSDMLSLELAIIGDAKWHRFRSIHHKNDHHIDCDRLRCKKDNFIDCLYLMDFLKND